jgi:hypothetical protein
MGFSAPNTLSTQEGPLAEKPSPCWMCGRATFTMVRVEHHHQLGRQDDKRRPRILEVAPEGLRANGCSR